MNTHLTNSETDVPDLAATNQSIDYFLIDGSGSMTDKWWEIMGTLDEYLKITKEARVSSRGIAHVFDDKDLESIQRDAPLGEWKTMAEEPLGAHWGMTPLYDAINLMGRRLAALNPAKCVITIVTDGLEQGSIHTTVTEARAVLDWCRANGWQVVFLGAEFNNSQQARALGADESNTIGVQRKLLTKAGELLGRKRAAFAAGADEIAFTTNEKTQFGGYLTDGTSGK